MTTREKANGFYGQTYAGLAVVNCPYCHRMSLRDDCDLESCPFCDPDGWVDVTEQGMPVPHYVRVSQPAMGDTVRLARLEPQPIGESAMPEVRVIVRVPSPTVMTTEDHERIQKSVTDWIENGRTLVVTDLVQIYLITLPTAEIPDIKVEMIPC